MFGGGGFRGLRDLGRRMGRMLWIEVCVVASFVVKVVVFVGFGEECRSGEWREVTPESKLESGGHLKYLSAEIVRSSLV